MDPKQENDQGDSMIEAPEAPVMVAPLEDEPEEVSMGPRPPMDDEMDITP
jgi:hypothetical protein